MEETILKSGQRRDSGSCAVTALSKLRALGQRALPNLHDIFKASGHAVIASTSEDARVWRRDHANCAPKSREKIAKSFPSFGAPWTQKFRAHGEHAFLTAKLRFTS